MKMSYYYLRTIFISTLFIIELIQYGSANSIFISGGGYAELGDYPHHAHLQSNYYKILEFFSES